jgi:hypothetical protein
MKLELFPITFVNVVPALEVDAYLILLPVPVEEFICSSNGERINFCSFSTTLQTGDTRNR